MATDGSFNSFFGLSELDDPPAKWHKVRKREAGLKESLRLSELRTLLDCNSKWFQCEKKLSIEQSYIDVLHKILFYTQYVSGNCKAFTEKELSVLAMSVLRPFMAICEGLKDSCSGTWRSGHLLQKPNRTYHLVQAIPMADPGREYTTYLRQSLSTSAIATPGILQ